MFFLKSPFERYARLVVCSVLSAGYFSGQAQYLDQCDGKLPGFREQPSSPSEGVGTPPLPGSTPFGNPYKLAGGDRDKVTTSVEIYEIHILMRNGYY